jgi:hypothetical protein
VDIKLDFVLIIAIIKHSIKGTGKFCYCDDLLYCISLLSFTEQIDLQMHLLQDKFLISMIVKAKDIKTKLN